MTQQTAEVLEPAASMQVESNKTFPYNPAICSKSGFQERINSNLDVFQGVKQHLRAHLSPASTILFEGDPPDPAKRDIPDEVFPHSPKEYRECTSVLRVDKSYRFFVSKVELREDLDNYHKSQEGLDRIAKAMGRIVHSSSDSIGENNVGIVISSFPSNVGTNMVDEILFNICAFPRHKFVKRFSTKNDLQNTFSVTMVYEETLPRMFVDMTKEDNFSFDIDGLPLNWGFVPQSDLLRRRTCPGCGHQVNCAKEDCVFLNPPPHVDSPPFVTGSLGPLIEMNPIVLTGRPPRKEGDDPANSLEEALSRLSHPRIMASGVNSSTKPESLRMILEKNNFHPTDIKKARAKGKFIMNLPNAEALRILAKDPNISLLGSKISFHGLNLNVKNNSPVYANGLAPTQENFPSLSSSSSSSSSSPSPSPSSSPSPSPSSSSSSSSPSPHSSSSSSPSPSTSPSPSPSCSPSPSFSSQNTYEVLATEQNQPTQTQTNKTTQMKKPNKQTPQTKPNNPNQTKQARQPATKKPRQDQPTNLN